MVLEKLEPSIVWNTFETLLTNTPRESKKEAKIRAVVKKWVADQSKAFSIPYGVVEDAAGNLLIRVPATRGMESCPSILLQGHLDMVCETNRPGGFDFQNNPIPVRMDKNAEWVSADGTTLGADNGIGVSLALALLADRSKDNVHGPLEILFTVDEETGLTGAFALDTKSFAIKSRMMLNLDSEKTGYITIGSAGGGDLELIKELPQTERPGKDKQFMKLNVSGLQGGHSGVDIHLPRASANKIMARFLSLLSREVGLSLCYWNGGTKHNAITREAEAKFAVPTEKAAKAEQLLAAEKTALLAYYKNTTGNASPLEPNMKIEWAKSDPAPIFSADDSSRVLSTASIIPHGPIRFSPDVPGLVETSCNFAIAKIEGPKILFHLSTRSSVDAELEALRNSLVDLAKLGGWNVEKPAAYPGWKPEPKSKFLQFVKSHYESVLQREVIIEAVHAGLECGIIGARIPGMQMVSIGPTVENAHSPDERLRIADVAVFYRLLKDLLSSLPTLKS
jgi:dipeptidase D